MYLNLIISKKLFLFRTSSSGERITHGVQQEADVALDQLHHSVDVHHRLLIPPAQIGTNLSLQVLQLTHPQRTKQCCIGNVKMKLQLHCTVTLHIMFSYLWGLQAAVKALDIFIKL